MTYFEALRIAGAFDSLCRLPGTRKTLIERLQIIQPLCPPFPPEVDEKYDDAAAAASTA